MLAGSRPQTLNLIQASLCDINMNILFHVKEELNKNNFNYFFNNIFVTDFSFFLFQ